MEEAAQITEVETFIPLALQAPRDGELPLQRVVLCGDHFQNSPIVQNIAFRQYANLEQSLFARLVRLGVPTVNLDQQGRARPSIAQLYNWRYRELGNLPLLDQQPEYQTANSGYVDDFNFVCVSLLTLVDFVTNSSSSTLRTTKAKANKSPHPISSRTSEKRSTRLPCSNTCVSLVILPRRLLSSQHMSVRGLSSEMFSTVGARVARFLVSRRLLLLSISTRASKTTVSLLFSRGQPVPKLTSD